MKTTTLKFARWRASRESKSGLAIWITRLAKALVSLAVLAFVGWKMYEERAHLIESFASLTAASWIWIGIALGLLGGNLGLEARKWYLMIRPLYPRLQYRRAFAAVLAGITTGIFTPNRIGEYAGRLWMLPNGKRLEAGGYTFVSRVCQMAITLLFGMIALEYIHIYHQEEMLQALPIGELVWNLWRISARAICIGVWIVLLRPSWWRLFFSWIPLGQTWFQKLTSSLVEIRSNLIRKVLGLSLMRFVVFALQYVCLIRAFGDSHDWLLLWMLVGLVFWINSVIPSITLTELGIRESIALVVMGGVGVSSFSAFSSTFLLYWINLVIPALIGLWVLYRVESWK